MLKCLCKISEIRESAATTESARSLEVFFFTVGATFDRKCDNILHVTHAIASDSTFNDVMNL